MLHTGVQHELLEGSAGTFVQPSDRQPEHIMSSRSLIFDSSSTVVAAPDQVSCDIGSQMAILHLKSGIYYGLDAVGTRVWELVQEPRRLGDIERVLLSEYEVERGRLAVELRDLCQTLAKAGLIEISDATRG